MLKVQYCLTRFLIAVSDHSICRKLYLLNQDHLDMSIHGKRKQDINNVYVPQECDELTRARIVFVHPPRTFERCS